MIILHWAYTATSIIITTLFLIILTILGLWHNLMSVISKRKKHKKARKAMKSRLLHRKSDSISMGISLNSNTEGLSGVAYDSSINRSHMINSNTERDSMISADNSNPFQDVLSGEDLKLIPNLNYYYEQYGIQIKQLEVKTEDGFILDLWHLESMDLTEKGKYPILMLHGLLQSSGSFASSGRKSLAYFLHQSGFDVWLGNNRCGFNKKVNKNIKNTCDHWDWDLKEMVRYDIKALIEVVLHETNYEKLTLIGHSQGTTQVFMGLVNGEDIYQDCGFRLIDKLDNFVAMAPAVYPGPLLDTKLFVRFMAKFIDSPWVFGNNCFLPMLMSARSVMVGHRIFSFLSYIIFNYLFDWNDILWDKPLRNRHFLFSPVYISVKLMQWWLSKDPMKHSFKNFSQDIFPDRKTWFPIDNKNIYEDEQLHNNIKCKDADKLPKIIMFVPKQDKLVDGVRLINHFVNYEAKCLYKIWYIEEYSHLDVLWAHDVIERIGKKMIEEIRTPTKNN